MKRRWLVIALVICAVGTALVLQAWAGRPSQSDLATAEPAAQPARIMPDYGEIVIPPNIAPLNFRVAEPGTEYLAVIGSDAGGDIRVSSREGNIAIPARPWRRLLQANRGGSLSIDIYAKQQGGSWRHFPTIENRIATERIDSHIAYRLMKPQYNFYRSLGVYQRCLETFNESLILHGRSYKNGCVNCHTFLDYDPENMLLGVRSPTYGNAALLVHDGRLSTIGTPFGHTAWHPSGRVAVFSRYDVRMFFHSARTEVRDVVEFDSLLGYYRFDAQELKTAAPLAVKSDLETQPTWSPDGKFLYFVSAPKLWTDMTTFPPDRYAEVKYDLKRIAYDVDADEWGAVETVLSAQETGRSIQTPRVSPDGRFLLFAQCDYSCFALYQPSSDLYLLDLESGDYRKLACNSDYAESWHAWSSNGRWVVFSSKRPTGIFTRLYFSYVDEQGNASKPFILPQRDPTFYDSFVQLYNVPEFISGPVRTSTAAFVRAVRTPDRVQVNAITAATAKDDASEPWRHGPE